MAWSKGEFLRWSLVILLLFGGILSAQAEQQQDALPDVANVQFSGGKYLFFGAPGNNAQPTRASESETLSDQMKRMSDYDVKDSFDSEEVENPSEERLKKIDGENYRNVLKADGNSSEVDTDSYIYNNSTNVTSESTPTANMTYPSDQTTYLTVNDTDPTINITTLFPKISSTPDVSTTTTTSTDTSTGSPTESSEQTKISDYHFSTVTTMGVTTHNSSSGKCQQSNSCTNNPGLVAGIVVSAMILIVILFTGTFYIFKRKWSQDEERKLLIGKV